MDFLKTKSIATWHFIKRYKRYSIGAIIIIGIWFSQLFWWSQEETKTQKTYVVTTWTIKNSIKVLGDTKITNQQTLTFWYEWTVKALYVKEWDTVKKWQLIAEIDKSDLQKSIAQQSLSLQNTKISYQKSLNQYSSADKMKAQQNIDDTQLKLDQAKRDLQEMVANQWDSLQTNSSQAQSYLLSTKSMILDIDNTIETVDKIFGFTTKWAYINEDIQIYISAKNSSEKLITKDYFNQVTSALKNIKNSLQIIENSPIVTIDALQKLQQENTNLLNNLSTMLSYALSAVKNSVVSTDLTQSQIDSRASTISSASSKTISYLSTINQNIDSIRTTENDIQNKKNEIKNYEALLASYKETLQDMVDGISYEDKILQQNNIKQGEISLSKLTEQTEDYELRAPFDGNIDMITFKVGDNITYDTISDEGITVSNPNFYEINMLIDQVDIVKIEKWQLANITFDAYEWYEVTWSITNIDPTPVESAWVVSYTAIIAMEKGEKKIYDSMTVNIEIITEEAKDVIVVPTTAIQTRWERIFVRVQNDDTRKMQPIEIWIHDTFNTEVISGLNLSATVLLNEYTSTNSSNNSSSNWSSAQANGMSSMRWLGVGGWGGGFVPRD